MHDRTALIHYNERSDLAEPIFWHSSELHPTVTGSSSTPLIGCRIQYFGSLVNSSQSCSLLTMPRSPVITSPSVLYVYCADAQEISKGLMAKVSNIILIKKTLSL